jgi:hypothetical protein
MRLCSVIGIVGVARVYFSGNEGARERTGDEARRWGMAAGG